MLALLVYGSSERFAPVVPSLSFRKAVQEVDEAVAHRG
jgi:hypothetical protein